MAQSTSTTPFRKVYVDGPYGQIHLRETAPVPGRVPLVCLHATAYSSHTFDPLMAASGGARQVIAIDAPGYGGSDAPAAPIDIGGYACAIEAAIRARCDGAVDVLGYHTGAYIAAELALAAPAVVARLVLIGIPYFEALDREYWRMRLTMRHRLTADLAQFDERWDYLVAQPHAAGLPLARAFANFRAELAAWPDGSRAHEAMFAWDSHARLPLIEQPVRVINPGGHLAPASRAAAALMKNAEIIEMPDLEGPIFDLAPGRILDAAGAVRVQLQPGPTPCDKVQDCTPGS